MKKCEYNIGSTKIEKGGSYIKGSLGRDYCRKIIITLILTVSLFPALIFANLVDVTQAPYNADNTGTTDASSAIQSALNALSSTKKSLFFPSGTYKLDNQISIPSSVSLIGESRTGTIFSCNYNGIQFKLSATLKYININNITFNGNGTNDCFSAGTSNYGYFGVNFNTLLFKDFGTAIDKKASLYCKYKNVQFRDNSVGISMHTDYHNVNTIDSCYFENNSVGISFAATSNGSSLALISTAFDVNGIGIDAYRPIEIVNGYFERNSTGLKLNGTTATIGRCYWLGDSNSPSTLKGIVVDGGRIIEVGQFSFVDNFATAIEAKNSSIINKVYDAEWSSYYLSIDDTSKIYSYETTAAVVAEAPNQAVEEYTMTNLGTTPVSLASHRLSAASYIFRIKSSGSTRGVFSMMNYVSNGCYRAKAIDSSGTISTISSNQFSVSGLGDGKTYTFTVNSGTGFMTANADSTISGDVIFSIQATTNIKI